MRNLRRLILLLVGSLTVTACGGGSTSSSTSTTRTAAANPEQARLLTQLRSGLEEPTSPIAKVRDLDECIVQQAKRLPLASLRKLAAGDVGIADTNPLVARCVAQGKGLSWVRGVIANVVSGKLPPPVPAAFSQCLLAGVNKLTPDQLATALNKGANGNQAYSRRLGRQIALACVKKPAVFGPWRKLWLTEIRRSLSGRHLPAAFVHCVLDKAGKIGPTELVKLVQAGSAAETAYGEKLGRACRPSLSG
ncbi:MAG TPA: hypothetical protein VJU80_18100 [Solirubrobacteraceae bacterium]|nr:hypothetical protein [Solirubrobacteraceae bacterium]